MQEMPRHSPPRAPLALFGLVALSASLALAAYALLQARETARQQARTALAERDRARQAETLAAARLAAVRTRLGGVPGQDFDDMLAELDEEIARLGGGSPNDSYVAVARRLADLLKNSEDEFEHVLADKQELERNYEAQHGIKQAAIQEAATATQQARSELFAERAEFEKKMTSKDAEIAAIMDRASTLAARLETERRDKAKVREELLTQVNKLRKVLVEARAPYTPSALAHQKPDGKVVRSSAATRTAWVNIGSRDGVQPLLTFSVQPQGFSGNPYTKPKAKLEVVRVVAPDLSEARIVEQTLTNPVLDGDLLFNPAWSPGRVMRFALAGLLDLDEDGRDDRPLVRQLIERAGARIDAEVLADGTQRGEVNVETNYFIRGKAPEPIGPAAQHTIHAMAEMERTALDYGAVVIELGKFLDLMGYSRRHGAAAAAPTRPRLAPVDNPSIRRATPSSVAN